MMSRKLCEVVKKKGSRQNALQIYMYKHRKKEREEQVEETGSKVLDERHACIHVEMWLMN